MPTNNILYKVFEMIPLNLKHSYFNKYTSINKQVSKRDFRFFQMEDGHERNFYNSI